MKSFQSAVKQNLTLMGLIVIGFICLPSLSMADFQASQAEVTDFQAAQEHAQMKINVRSLYALQPGYASLVTGTISENTTWTADSYFHLQGEVRLAKEATLTIQPGVRIDFDPEASLFLEGIIIARGHPRSPILITCSERQSLWERIIFSQNSTADYDDQGNYRSGSIIEYAIVERGGTVSSSTEGEGEVMLVEGGMILINSSSPYLHGLILRSGHSSNGGAIALTGNADPKIEGCEIINNRADGNGGGIYVGLNSTGFFCNNCILNNTAGRDGGGVYLSFSSSLIIRNVIEGNEAERDGGGLVIGGMTPQLRFNVFRGNEAKREGDNLLVRQSYPTIEDNAFFTSEGENAIAAQPFAQDFPQFVIANNNYWNATESFRLDRMILDKRVMWDKPTIDIIPILETIPDELPLQPVELTSFDLFEDNEYTRQFSTDYIGFGTKIFLEAQGRGSHPDLIDYLFLDCQAEGGDSLRLILAETGGSSNVFRSDITVAEGHLTDSHILATQVGEKITLTPFRFPQFTKTFPVQLQKPIIRDVKFIPREEFILAQQQKDLPPNAQLLGQDGVSDLTHLIDDNFLIAWTYFEPGERPQRSRRMNLLNEQGELIWSSGNLTGSATRLAYEGEPLAGGSQQTIQLEVSQGISWSSPQEIKFRRNSVPSTSTFITPESGETVRTLEPSFRLDFQNDSEGDPLWAKIELRLVESTDPMPSSLELTSDWIPVQPTSEINYPFTTPLIDNAYYEIRAELSDGLETCGFSGWHSFIVNLANEPPGEFTISHPPAGYEVTLKDYIAWSLPLDPDPGDELTYTVQVGAELTALCTANQLAVSDIIGVEEATEDVEVLLTVIAQDHEGLTSVAGGGAQSVYLNLHNNAPLPPDGFNYTDGARARDLPVLLTWNASYDQDRSDTPDVISYTIEIDQASELGKLNFFNSPGETSLLLEGVADNQIITWRIRAMDDEGEYSDWTPEFTMIINQADEPPNPFALISPADGARPYEFGMTHFSWRAATDPDPQDEVQYRFELANSPDFGITSLLTQADLDSTSYLYAPELEHAQMYYWRVQAIDLTNLSTLSTTNSFEIISTPSIPAWRGELPAELTNASRIEWLASTDPNPKDIIVYRIELSVDERFIPGRVAIADNLSNTSITVREITGFDRLIGDDDPVYVRLQARDNHNLESDWSQVKSSYLNLENDDPDLPTLLSPSEVTETTARPTFTWGAASDPDHSDPPSTLSYEIEIASAADPGRPIAGGQGSVRGEVSWKPSRALPDNNRFVWRLRTVDKQGAASPWSNQRPFQIDTKPEKPLPFVLLEPADGAVVTVGSAVTFKWRETTDPDLDSSVKYQIQIGQQNFGPFDKTEFTFTLDQPAGSLSWFVTAVDNTGLTTNSAKFKLILQATGASQ